MEIPEQIKEKRRQDLRQNIERAQKLIQECDAQIGKIETDPQSILEKFRKRNEMDKTRLEEQIAAYEKELGSM